LVNSTQEPSILSNEIKISLVTNPSVNCTDCHVDWDSIVSFIENDDYDLYLSLMTLAINDLAEPANTNYATASSMPETFPNCECAASFFIEEKCTTVYDRVCKVCSTCPDDFYIGEQCSGFSDNVCERCTPCKYGFYEEQACSRTGTSDRICDKCDSCGEYEYEISPCSGGINRLCGSCKVCKMTDIQKSKCKQIPEWWTQENCCFDSLGEQVACRDLTEAEMTISAAFGRRHWVVERTFPEVEGYEPGSTEFLEE